MKKIITRSLAIGLLLLMAVSCSSTKKVEAAADSYDDGTATEITAGSEEIPETGKKDSQKNNKKKKNIVKEIFSFGNRDDYSKYYEIGVYQKEITGMKEKRATTLIRTDDYMAGFGCYYQLAYYIIQFDDVNRQRLIEAANTYFKDFEEKNLQRKGKRTEQAYGKISYRLDWGSISSTTPNNGSGNGYVGYKFIKGSPYFTISNYPFKNNHYDVVGDTTTRESIDLCLYFTKAQLRELLEFLSTENINKLVTEMNENLAASEADTY